MTRIVVITRRKTLSPESLMLAKAGGLFTCYLENQADLKKKV